jgi:hypothetical protein
VSASATDYIGMWYRARARLGIDDRIEFIFINPGSGKRHTVALRHRDHDGVGGIAESLKRMGVRQPPMPLSRQTRAPSFWRRWQARPEQRQPQSPPWRIFTTTVDEQADEPLVQWLTPLQTRALRQRAKAQQVSLNSLLLKALHLAVADTLMTHASPISWCFPVNMRGVVPMGRPDMNLSSAFYMTVDSDDSLTHLDHTIRSYLKANIHWRYWHLARIGRLVGQRGVDWLCGRLLNGAQHGGSFSNLGEWQIDFVSGGLAPDTVFACCGPGSPTHPVANGMMIVNGSLSLALKLHPSLGASEAVVQECLQRWVDELGVTA